MNGASWCELHGISTRKRILAEQMQAAGKSWLDICMELDLRPTQVNRIFERMDKAHSM